MARKLWCIALAASLAAAGAAGEEASKPAEQQKPAAPFDAPRSQSSPASTVPLPQFASAL